MRIAFFHNWSWLGSALASEVLRSPEDEVWLVGSNLPSAERDPDLEARARQENARSVVPDDVEDPAFVAELRAFAPDLLVVGTFARKLSATLLAVPRVAAINVHSSLLPAYRGAIPEFWVIRNGERRTGVSIHTMTERFDAGGILAQVAVDIEPDDTLFTVSMRINRAAPPLLGALLARYRAGERPRETPQDDTSASRAPMVREHHLEVRWDEPALRIERLVRASFPIFEAHTRLRGQRLVIRRARLTSSPRLRDLEPGVLAIDHARERLLVGTGEGVLDLVTIDPGQDTTLGGFAFAREVEIRPGERLGD